jgi:hypothetical protein
MIIPGVNVKKCKVISRPLLTILKVYRKVQAVKLATLGTTDEPQDVEYPEEWEARN